MVKFLRGLTTSVFLWVFLAAGFSGIAPAAASVGPVTAQDPRVQDLRNVPLRTLTKDEIISPEAVRSDQSKPVKIYIFDARSQEVYDTAHVEGAVLPLDEEYYRQRQLFRKQLVGFAPDPDIYLVQAMAGYPKDGMFVTYCEAGCHASAQLLLKMKRLGYQNVKSMEEGFSAWQRKGYPVVLGTPKLSLEAAPKPDKHD